MEDIVNNMGIYKVDWSNVRTQLEKVNSELVKIVDELSPNSKFPLYLTTYHYGDLISNKNQFHQPHSAINTYSKSSFSDKTVNQFKSNTTHAKFGLPLGMVFNNSVELFIEHEQISLPCHVYKAGDLLFFPSASVLGTSSHSCHPSGLLHMSSGSRSIFSLPSLGNETKHQALKTDYRIKYPAVKQLGNHWHLFKDIYNINSNRTPWHSSLLFFSDRWINTLKNDKAWNQFKLYLHHVEEHRKAFVNNKEYYDYIFSILQITKNLKPDPYISDTARHIISILAGSALGYKAAVNEEKAPITIIQKALIESYEIDYCPTIFEPDYYNDANKNIYYSLQKPTVFNFSPKGKKSSSTINDLVELKYIISKVFSEMFGDHSPCANTLIYQIAKNTTINLYHNKIDNRNEIQLSNKMTDKDKNLLYLLYDTNKYMPFSDSGQFIRGCIGLENTK